jgi:hypothetical protein
MMLFTTKDISQKKEADRSEIMLSDAEGMQAGSLGRRDRMALAIGALADGQHMHFVSAGQWSMHDLLEEMLRRSGPAHVHIATWAATEDPARRIVMLKQQGMALSLSCLLDYKMQGRKPGPFQLLQANADRLALAKCHAKVTAVINDHFSMVCVGSANLSRNPRFEAGVISACRGDAEFHISWINKAIDDAAGR